MTMIPINNDVQTSTHTFSRLYPHLLDIVYYHTGNRQDQTWNHISSESERWHPYEVHSTFRVVWATPVNSGLHAGNMKLNTQNKEWLSIDTINYIYNFTFVSFYAICATRYTENNMKKFKKNTIHNWVYGVIIFGTFSQDELVM